MLMHEQSRHLLILSILLASCNLKGNDMPIRRLPGNPPPARTRSETTGNARSVTVGGILDAVEGSLRPHEIDGDIIPVEEGEEYEGPQSGPRRNPLDDLREAPTPPTGSLFDRIITMTLGDQVGIARTVPPTTAANLNGTEILTVKADDQLNGMFSVTIGQYAKPFNPLGNISGVGEHDTPVFPAAYTRVGGNFAIVQWGAGGVQFQTIVDIIPGQTFTVGGSFLRIIAFQRSLVDGTGAATDIQVGVFVSLLPRGTPRSAIYTEPIGALAAAAFAVPRGIYLFAKTVRVDRAPQSAPFTVRIVQDAAGANLISEHAIAAGVDCPDIPLPGNAHHVEILNGATAWVSGTMIVTRDM